MSDDLVYQRLEEVRDAKTFIVFLQSMLDDLPDEEEKSKYSDEYLYLVGVRDWMNHDLNMFFDAAIAGGSSNRIGFDAKTPEQAWKAAARILYLGKVYE